MILHRYASTLSTLMAVSLLITGCGSRGSTSTGNSNTGTGPLVSNSSVANSPSSGEGGVTNSSSTNKSPYSAKAPKHVVVVIEENHAYRQIIGNTGAPYLNSLARQGALFTNYQAVTHPSQPNYIALFAGSTLGIRSDSCPHTLNAPNLASELMAKGYSFTGYSESLPAVGSNVCSTAVYARKHAPWVNFSNLPKKINQPLSRFPSDYTNLPTISFVIPNVRNDMHSGSVSAGDNWLQQHLGSYAQWAQTHDSLLVVTFDEGVGRDNQVATVFYGAGVKAGRYNQSYTHYSLLRTLESFYQLAPLGNSKTASPMNVALRNTAAQ